MLGQSPNLCDLHGPDGYGDGHTGRTSALHLRTKQTSEFALPGRQTLGFLGRKSFAAARISVANDRSLAMFQGGGRGGYGGGPFPREGGAGEAMGGSNNGAAGGGNHNFRQNQARFQGNFHAGTGFANQQRQFYGEDPDRKSTRLNSSHPV